MPSAWLVVLHSELFPGGRFSLLVLLGFRLYAAGLWSFPEITSRGQPGFPNSRTVAMQKRKMRVEPTHTQPESPP